MKAIAVLLLACVSLPRVQTSPQASPSSPVAHLRATEATAPRARGKWYFARSGHAVYCYGPVMTLTDVSGNIEHVATFCRGNRLMVPLRD